MATIATVTKGVKLRKRLKKNFESALSFTGLFKTTAWEA